MLTNCNSSLRTANSKPKSLCVLSSLVMHTTLSLNGTFSVTLFVNNNLLVNSFPPSIYMYKQVWAWGESLTNFVTILCVAVGQPWYTLHTGKLQWYRNLSDIILMGCAGCSTEFGRDWPKRVVDCVWNVMAHAQKPDFVFRRNGRAHLNRPGGVSSVDYWQPRCAHQR